jgi:hypothetical protein
MEKLSRIMKHNAKQGIFTGAIEEVRKPYFMRCRQWHRETGTLIIFTQDIGYHSSGWFKNPDYERCYHLSLSFHDLETHTYRPFDVPLSKVWVHSFFGDWVRYIWEEGQTPEAKKNPDLAESKHYRVFCDPAWQPIIPRGEVYTKDFTEKGWLSWSDKQYEKQQLKDKQA